MRCITRTLAIVGMGLAVGAAAGDRPPARGADSENGAFHLQIRPGQPGGEAVRGCKATLYQRSAERHRGRTCWSRFLVNDVAPGVALVRNDGRFVITLDEYGRGGARHALAIYGERGELLRHFLLPDLLEPEDWQHVRIERRAIRWLDGAKFEFTEQPEQFVVKLKHGRTVRIDLRTLQVVRADRERAQGAAAVPAEYLALLFGQSGVADAPENAELAELSPEERAIAEALAREMAGGPEPDQPTAGEETSTPARSTREPAEEAPAQEHAEFAGRQAVGAIVVPRPDPADPVDYLAWVNELTRVSGPNAAHDYQAAMDRLSRWEGDRELLRAASRGEAAALAAPEIAEWLAANADALAHFRAAAHLEHAGWELFSADGSMIGAMLPNLSSLRELAYATVVEGRLLADAGQVDDAPESYLNVLAAGSHVGNGPTLIENLVGIAMQALGARAMLDLFAGDAPDELNYASLAAALDHTFQGPRPLAEAVQFERAMFMDTVQRIYDYDPETGRYVLNEQAASLIQDIYSSNVEPTKADKVLERLRQVGFEETVRAGEEFYDAATQALLHPYPEARRQLQQLEARFDQRRRTNPLLASLAASFERCHFLNTRAEALRRATRLVAHLRAYRQQYGSYPETLDILGDAELASDPFTTTTFRYCATADDFVLYSVGANGIDDGGVHDPRGETNDYLLWPPPAR